jgi:hypothetical protein
MCQIISGSSAQLKLVLLSTEGLLEELHKNNPDGWGAMYHTTKGVKAIKKLPATAEDTRKYIQKLPDDDRQVALHWRWRTSGNVDQHNAHPHQVVGGWLIHNGVLDVDTDTKPEMCDTYHFARQYLDGVVPAVVGSNGLQTLIGEFIGNNRFVLMTDDGAMCIINKHQGYTAQDLWFANTYSMSRHRVDPTCPKPVVRPYQYNGFKSYPKANWDVGGGMSGATDLWDDAAYDASYGYPGLKTIDPEEDMTFVIRDEVDQALEESDSDGLQACLEEFPDETLRHVFASYDITEYAGASEEDLTPAVSTVRKEVLALDRRSLVTRLEADQMGVVSDRIAQCLLWFCIVEWKMEALA